jgi:hypothetical protein
MEATKKKRWREEVEAQLWRFIDLKPKRKRYVSEEERFLEEILQGEYCIEGSEIEAIRKLGLKVERAWWWKGFLIFDREKTKVVALTFCQRTAKEPQGKREITMRWLEMSGAKHIRFFGDIEALIKDIELFFGRDDMNVKMEK